MALLERPELVDPSGSEDWAAGHRLPSALRPIYLGPMSDVYCYSLQIPVVYSHFNGRIPCLPDNDLMSSYEENFSIPTWFLMTLVDTGGEIETSHGARNLLS